jgi:hypothetical protein
MAGYYRKKIADLRPAPTEEASRPQAVEVVRKLIERIVLTPVEEDGKKTLSITLEGHMAGILAIAANAKRRSMRATSESKSRNWLRGPHWPLPNYHDNWMTLLSHRAGSNTVFGIIIPPTGMTAMGPEGDCRLPGRRRAEPDIVLDLPSGGGRIRHFLNPVSL